MEEASPGGAMAADWAAISAAAQRGDHVRFVGLAGRYLSSQGSRFKALQRGLADLLFTQVGGRGLMVLPCV